MGRTCSICAHKKCKEIDLALAVEGASLRDIAGQYRVSKSALQRHLDNGHIKGAIVEAKQVKEIHEKSTFQDKHQQLEDSLITQQEAAHKEGKYELELKVIHERIRLHEIDGKASGVFREKVENSGTITIRFDKEDSGV